MKKCLKITFPTPVADQFLQLIHRQARTLKVEGTLAVIQPEQLVRIIVCGEKDEVDHFLDFIHKEGAKHNIHSIMAEPMLKERDYRGAFRIIE